MTEASRQVPSYRAIRTCVYVQLTGPLVFSLFHYVSVRAPF